MKVEEDLTANSSFYKRNNMTNLEHMHTRPRQEKMDVAFVFALSASIFFCSNFNSNRYNINWNEWVNNI